MSVLSSLAFNETPRGTGAPDGVQQITRLLQERGIHAPDAIYDEAIGLIAAGNMAQAEERLRMVLVLDPTDRDAGMLLGKVLADQRKWQEALSRLDSAAQAGAAIDAELRADVVEQLRRENQESEEQRRLQIARNREEVHALRSSCKQLRTEKAQIELRAQDLERRVKVWSSATALVGGSAAALLLAAMIFGGPSSSEEIAAPSTPIAAAPAPVQVGAAPVAPVAAAPVAAPVGQAPAAPAQPAGDIVTVHTVTKGDTLGRIARRYYGKSSEWQRILDANSGTLGGSVKALRPGMKLKIPPKP